MDTEAWKTLFYRTVPANARGPKRLKDRGNLFRKNLQLKAVC